MKTLYFECNMGAAGDMLMAALLELHPSPADFIKRLNEIGIPNTIVSAETSVKCGIKGTHVSVKINGKEELTAAVHDFMHSKNLEHPHHEHTHSHNDSHSYDHGHSHGDGHSHDDEHTHEHGHSHGNGHSHSHNGLGEIEHIVSHLNISDKVKANVVAVYKLIAHAESHAHGVPVTEIHFHEVGNLDAIADIVGVCMLMEELAPEKILASPIHVGSGMVRCAHGILPVPAPATAHILQGVPVYGGSVRSELCTPTGAAILKHFATEFGPMSVLKIEKCGYGMGKKDFEQANCVRAFLGDA